MQNSVIHSSQILQLTLSERNNMKLSYLCITFLALWTVQNLNAQSYTRAEVLNKDEKVQKRMLEVPGMVISDLLSADWQQQKAKAGAEVRVISDSVFYKTAYTRKLHILQFPERYVIIPDAYFVRPISPKNQ